MQTATSTAELMDLGITCLLKNLGTIQTERFISALIREQSDYTRWRQNYFDSVNPEDYMNDSVAYDRSHPFTPKKKQIPIN